MTTNFNLIEYSLYYAISAHVGQFRKDGVTPYIVHPIEVMRLLQKCGVTDEKMLAVALLHDVLEDTRVTYGQLSVNERFAGYVADSVLHLTIPVGVNKQDYIDSFVDKPLDLVKVKAADRICNVKDFMASGDKKYAAKYLKKGDAIFKPLLDEIDGVAFNLDYAVERSLLFEYMELRDTLDMNGET